jgi:hypothetical protein
MTRDDEGVEFRLIGQTFGQLGVQLLQAIAQASTVAVCSGCGRTYHREGRRPQAGRRNYCPVCRREGVPVKMAKRDYRKRRNTNVEES